MALVEDFTIETAESSEDELNSIAKFIKTKTVNTKKKGRKPQWSEHLCNYLVDIILQNETFTKKLLLENVKTKKNQSVL